MKHGTAASTGRTLCSTARLLTLAYAPLKIISGLRRLRIDDGKAPSAPSNGDMVLQLKAWRSYRVCPQHITHLCTHMYAGQCFMLSHVYRGALHSGCVRHRAPTQTQKLVHCWSDPTIPRQPGTTSSLPSKEFCEIASFIQRNNW